MFANLQHWMGTESIGRGDLSVESSFSFWPTATRLLSFSRIFLTWMLVSLSGNPQSEAIQSDQLEANRGENTQEELVPRISDQMAAQSWSVPDGLQLRLFSGSPLVSQPIAATVDRFGRVWVAENYTYSERPNIFQRDKDDRIVVLEDSDGDGVADRQSVFWDHAKLLSSVEVGMGGVWALCAPNLVFVPDANEDGIADGPAQIVLDGFEDQEIGHNMVNGLRWGPDGWLYGRHGIQATSRVGRPGTAAEKRIPLNCCIWRYHPVARKFEVVCQGTTNSWGHDWTEDGELLFINTVIGHLWHAIPNSHFERMYGEDLTPFVFELTPQVADHVHWDQSKEAWQAVQKQTSQATEAAGGGHAHSGLAIPQSPAWPKSLQGTVLAINFHGRRINCDSLEVDGAHLVAHHQADLAGTTDPWFRGIDLVHADRQSLLILDWQDLGECHDNDGIHRTSGRIYRLAPESAEDKRPDWSDLTASQWVEWLQSDDVFWQRRAREFLQQQTFVERDEASNQSFESVRKALVLQLRNDLVNAEPLVRLRSLWALQATGALTEGQLKELLKDDEPLLRRWAVRLLADGIVFSEGAGAPVMFENPSGLTLSTLPSSTVKVLLELAEIENDPQVLVYLASAMRRMTLEDRWTMGMRLAFHQELQDDRVFPNLVWYGLEPAVVPHATSAGQWLLNCRIGKLQQFVTRRLAIAYTEDKAALSSVLTTYLDTADSDLRKRIWQGLVDGWRGWSGLEEPADWQKVRSLHRARIAAGEASSEESLLPVFQQNRSVDQWLAIVNDGGESWSVRGFALENLGRRVGSGELPEAQLEKASTVILGKLHDRFLASAAVKAIAASRTLFPQALQAYAQLNAATRSELIQSCCEYEVAAKRLLQLVAENTIAAEDLSPYALRQLQLLGDEEINAMVKKLWPQRELFAQNQLEKIQQWKELLKDVDFSAGDYQAGYEVFQQQCAKCHRLFGEGGSVGPELTGGQRSNLTYWLQNILAPSAEVAQDFRMSIIQLNDGRVVSGVITEKTPVSFRLVTQTDDVLVRQEDVEAIKESDLSLMPDGILDALDREKTVQLLGYLMAPTRPEVQPLDSQ